MLGKAKEAKSVEELAALAKENGIELTRDQASAYFAQLHPTSGEISDDELDNVAGGGCRSGDGRLVVTTGYLCTGYVCKSCDRKCRLDNLGGRCKTCGGVAKCGTCKYCTYENGLWLCNSRKNSK